MESHAKADAAFWKLAESKMIHYRGPFLPYLIERAEGSYIYDSNGRRILDFTSGQMSSILGHGHPEIAAVVAWTISSPTFSAGRSSTWRKP
jgi:2,2-dialkylglycine decarboxylase (pyruvate)